VTGRPREFDLDEALGRAMQLFWRQGYEGTSLSDLTRELRLTRPSLYAAFGSKQGLFLRALDLYEKRAGYRQAALTAPTVEAYARALLEGAADLHGDKRNPPGCLGVQGALACAPQSDPIRKELIRRRQIGERSILARLKRGKKEGELPRDADPADLARYLSVVIYGITIQAAGGATRRELRNVADLAMRGLESSRTKYSHSTLSKKPGERIPIVLLPARGQVLSFRLWKRGVVKGELGRTALIG
jgi:AcrR family transcriptional regulator